MYSSSSSYSDISGDELEEFEDKVYQKIVSTKIKVVKRNGALTCPFCRGKKKHIWPLPDLLQHARDIGHRGNATEKKRARHRALHKWLETDYNG